MTTTKQSPHVLIVGAGLAGLTLAQALRKKGITFQIFERDAAIHARFQGWAIALHEILPDLKASLPEDLGPVESTSHLLPLDLTAQFSFYNANKRVSDREHTESEPLVRANRVRLRDYLAKNLDIQWGVNWTRIEENSDSVKLYFGDGTSAEGDILVGGDGVHSKVRRHMLSGEEPLNTLPLGILTGETKLSPEQFEKVMSYGRSAYMANTTSGQRMMIALNAVDWSGEFANYYWMVNWVDHQPDKDGLPATHHMSKEELYALALEHTSDFDPKLTEVIRLTKPEGMLTPPLVFRDIVLDSLPTSRVTLIGDAAHAMTPFRGQGGNVALQDSLNLARTIEKIRDADGREQILSLIGEYQTEMLARSRPIVLASRHAATMESGEFQSPFTQWHRGAKGQPAKGQPVAA